MTDQEQTPRATFDIDESTAALVLQHVHDVADRCALACTSRLWREVATVSACFDRLVIDGTIATRLTDERMRWLLSHVGHNLRSVEVHGAPSAFSGEGLLLGGGGGLLSAKSHFPNLQTLIIHQCPGVKATFVGSFLRSIGIDDRKKAHRLDQLGLAGCDMSKLDLAALDEYVRHDRDVRLPFAEGHFDLWPCVHCPNVIDDGLHCVQCKSVACASHGEEGTGTYICFFCNAYVCLSDACGVDDEADEAIDEHTTFCSDCGVRLCYDCACFSSCAQTCTGSDDKAGCFQTLCEGCDEKKGYTFTLCHGECGGLWCADCAPVHPIMCFGSDDKKGCFKTMCDDCDYKEGYAFTICRGGCNSIWCADCTPADTLVCFGSVDKEGCLKTLCNACDERKGGTFTLCHGSCNGEWCSDCAPADAVTCAGSEKAKGCFKTLCIECDEKEGYSFTLCDGRCGGFWCAECLPAGTLSCTGSGDAEGCSTCICQDCNDTGTSGEHITTCPGCGATRCDDCVTSLDRPLGCCMRCKAV